MLPVTKLQTTLDFFRFPSTAWRGSPSVPRRTKCRGGHQAQTSQAASDQLSGFEVIQKSDLHRARRRLKLSSYGLTQGIDLRKPWFLTYCLPWLSMFIMFFFFLRGLLQCRSIGAAGMIPTISHSPVKQMAIDDRFWSGFCWSEGHFCWLKGQSGLVKSPFLLVKSQYVSVRSP